MAGETCNLVYGRTKNPYDLSRIAGGSSGGEGALISACGSLFGVGSDVGGSIRGPAHFNGIFGHKTTPGVIDMDGIYPEIKPAINTLGPLCRYARDLRPCLEAMAGVEGRKKLKLDMKMNLSDLKVFYSHGFENALMTAVQPAIIEAIEKAVQHLRERAKEVKYVQFEQFKNMNQIFNGLWAEEPATEASKMMTSGRYDIDMKREFLKWTLRRSNHTLEPLLFALSEKLCISKGSKEQVEFAKLGYKFKGELFRLLGDDGVLIFPTYPESAFKHATSLFKYSNSFYTFLWNVLKVCSTHVPMGLDANGLPIGFQVIGKSFNDHLTIRVANELSDYFGGWVSPSSFSIQNM